MGYFNLLEWRFSSCTVKPLSRSSQESINDHSSESITKSRDLRESNGWLRSFFSFFFFFYSILRSIACSSRFASRFSLLSPFPLIDRASCGFSHESSRIQGVCRFPRNAVEVHRVRLNRIDKRDRNERTRSLLRLTSVWKFLNSRTIHPSR